MVVINNSEIGTTMNNETEHMNMFEKGFVYTWNSQVNNGDTFDPANYIKSPFGSGRQINWAVVNRPGETRNEE